MYVNLLWIHDNAIFDKIFKWLRWKQVENEYCLKNISVCIKTPIRNGGKRFPRLEFSDKIVEQTLYQLLRTNIGNYIVPVTHIFKVWINIIRYYLLHYRKLYRLDIRKNIHFRPGCRDYANLLQISIKTNTLLPL